MRGRGKAGGLSSRSAFLEVTVLWRNSGIMERATPPYLKRFFLPKSMNLVSVIEWPSGGLSLLRTFATEGSGAHVFLLQFYHPFYYMRQILLLFCLSFSYMKQILLLFCLPFYYMRQIFLVFCPSFWNMKRILLKNGGWPFLQLCGLQYRNKGVAFVLDCITILRRGGGQTDAQTYMPPRNKIPQQMQHTT